jgi:hypothetical protein
MSLFLKNAKAEFLRIGLNIGKNVIILVSLQPSGVPLVLLEYFGGHGELVFFYKFKAVRRRTSFWRVHNNK